jgi:hypothetical protein
MTKPKSTLVVTKLNVNHPKGRLFYSRVLPELEVDKSTFVEQVNIPLDISYLCQNRETMKVRFAEQGQGFAILNFSVSAVEEGSKRGPGGNRRESAPVKREVTKRA